MLGMYQLFPVSPITICKGGYLYNPSSTKYRITTGFFRCFDSHDNMFFKLDYGTHSVVSYMSVL